MSGRDQDDCTKQHSEMPIGLKDICEKIHKVAEDVRVLGRFGGKRASTLVANAVRIMTSEQTERPFKVYQNFLCDIRTASGPLGRNMVVLCSATIGKTKAVTLNERDRITLVQYIATTSIRLDSEHLSSLAAQYNVPSTDNWLLGGVHLSQTDNPGGNNEPQNQLTHSLGGLDPQTRPASQELNENNVLSAQVHQVHGNQIKPGVPVTVPVKLAAIEVLQETVKGGYGDQLQIVLPDPFLQQPYMVIPLEIASQIMRKYTA